MYCYLRKGNMIKYPVNSHTYIAVSKKHAIILTVKRCYTSYIGIRLFMRDCQFIVISSRYFILIRDCMNVINL